MSRAIPTAALRRSSSLVWRSASRAITHTQPMSSGVVSARLISSCDISVKSVTTFGYPSASQRRRGIASRHEARAKTMIEVKRGRSLCTGKATGPSLTRPSGHDVASIEGFAAGGEDGESEEGGKKGGEEGAFDDPRVAILDASLDHVDTHGFSATALAAGAKDCGFHSVAAGMFPKGEVELIHHAMAKALEEVKKLSKEAEESSTGAAGDGDGKKTSPSSDWDDEGHEDDDEGDHETSSATERLRDGIHAALSSIVPYKKHWPHAMSIGALPQNAGATATAVAVLADELAFLSGDRSTDISWYGKRGLIAGIYASTELVMLTDDSEDLSETWSYLDRRLSDYETLASSPENAGDVITGVGTVATSLSSAVVSLAGPFLKQASKQVPGAETLAHTAPNVAALASQAMSFVASQVPHGQSTTTSPDSTASGADHGGVETTSPSDLSEPKANQAQHTYPGAPERDPWSDTPGAAKAKPGQFEEELAREERELFGGEEKGKGKGTPA